MVEKSKFKLLSSLEKVMFQFPDDCPETTHGSMLKNEIYSFQMVGVVKSNRDVKMRFRIEIDSPIRDFISAYEIGYVPSLLTHDPLRCDDDYITKMPGLLPDPLKRIRDNHFTMVSERTVAVWFSLEPNGNISGTYPIEIRIYDHKDDYVTKLCYQINIIDAELPEQKLLNTGWFHGDCIAALHNTEVGSQEYLEILDKYLAVYARFGHNTILTPIFTPPLDTDEGEERPTNQLIDVTVNNGTYSFNFEKLGSWIDRCKRHGITHFEIAHLFTQWGAYHAPKIMATVDGEYKRIFGWDTEPKSQEYAQFLHLFLPQLRNYLEEHGDYENCLFHVSDEPTDSHLEQYTYAKNIVATHIDSDRMMDACSRFAFYERGLIGRPVCANNDITPFLENKAKHLWTYYCCIQGKHVANRFMAMPSYRNRILGYQLYKYQIEGFLQWGFNFWFSARSRFVIDPYKVTDADEAFPSGDSFVVYPLDDSGEVVVSLRLYVFAEALQDMRALELLESMTSREAVLELLKEIDGFESYPQNAKYILSLREIVNNRIQKQLEKRSRTKETI